MEISQFFTEYAIQKMQDNGVTLELLGTRLAQGVPLEEAFSFKTRGRRSIYKKELYDQAKANGITRQLLYHRVNIQGMTPEEAATTPVGKRGKKVV